MCSYAHSITLTKLLFFEPINIGDHCFRSPKSVLSAVFNLKNVLFNLILFMCCSCVCQLFVDALSNTHMQ